MMLYQEDDIQYFMIFMAMRTHDRKHMYETRDVLTYTHTYVRLIYI